MSEPTITNKPAQHAAVIAAGVGFSVVVGAAFALLLSGDARSAGFAAIVLAVAPLPAMLPVLLGSKSVPSRFGGAVLFGTMGHTLATLGMSLLVVSAGDVEPRPVVAGIVLGAFTALSVQVGYAIVVLRQATPGALRTPVREAETG